MQVHRPASWTQSRRERVVLKWWWPTNEMSRGVISWEMLKNKRDRRKLAGCSGAHARFITETQRLSVALSFHTGQGADLHFNVDDSAHDFNCLLVQRRGERMVLVAGCEASPVTQLLHLWEVEGRARPVVRPLPIPRGAFDRDEQHQEDRKAVADRGSALHAASPGRWGAAHDV